MKSISKIKFIVVCSFVFVTAAFSQHSLSIYTHLDKSFERYTVTISDTNHVELAKFNFTTPDTHITYTFDSTYSANRVFVMLSGHSNITTYFHVEKNVPLTREFAFTEYHLQQLSKKDIAYYKKNMDGRHRSNTKKEYGIFKKGSPWMYGIGYTYQQSHLIDLEVRKTGVDITGSHGDGLYGLTLLNAPYILMGGDATVSPNFQFAPKVGVGYYFVIFNANVSFIAYNTNFSTFRPAIVPEAGLSAPFGFLHFSYGYNFYLDDLNTTDDNHRFTVRFTWYFNPKKVIY